MLRKLALLSIGATLFFGVLTPQNNIMAAKSSLTISADELNVRGGPGLTYPVVQKVRQGVKFPIIKEEGNWYMVDLGNGHKGWVANWFAVKSPIAPSANTKDAIVNSDGLRVRKGPGTSFQIISSLGKGARVTVVDSNENWYKISASFGEGWVAKQFLEVKEHATDRNSTKNDSANKYDGKNGLVVADFLNVRSDPSKTGTIIGKLKKGASVKIFSSQEDWIEISFSNKKGWVKSEFIDLDAKDSGTSTGTPSNGIMGVVTANSLNIRESTNLDAPIVGQVTKGQSFKILEESNNWTKIEYKPNRFGWVASWYIDKSSQASPLPSGQPVKESTVSVLQDGTNIRKKPDTSSDVLIRANQGESFLVKSIRSNWYEIKLKDGSIGYIAGWLVSVSGSAPRIEKPGAEIHLKNKTIVVDPGHGGEDSGTIGAKGTLEKNLTMRTALLLFDKLRASGANVILTRSNDTYISLRSRVSTSHYQGADAFVSIHYDSNVNRSVRGTTGYYYHDYQKSLAQFLYSSLVRQTGLQERGVRFGDFHVLRENKQRSTLLELGYLSNPEDEMLVNSPQFQETASNGIFNGLARYFKEN